MKPKKEKMSQIEKIKISIGIVLTVFICVSTGINSYTNICVEKSIKEAPNQIIKNLTTFTYGVRDSLKKDTEPLFTIINVLGESFPKAIEQAGGVDQTLKEGISLITKETILFRKEFSQQTDSINLSLNMVPVRLVETGRQIEQAGVNIEKAGNEVRQGVESLGKEIKNKKIF